MTEKGIVVTAKKAGRSIRGSGGNKNNKFGKIGDVIGDWSDDSKIVGNNCNIYIHKRLEKGQ